MKTRRAAGYSCLLLLSWLVLLMVPAFAGNKKLQPFVIQPDKFVVSQPLSEIAKTTPAPAFHGWIIRKEHETPNHMTKIYHLPDPVIQESSGDMPELAITLGFNFDGVNGTQAGGVIPPDTNGAVGDTQFFLTTNFAFSIYNKSTGKIEVGPLLLNSIFKGFGGQCEADNGGDPVVLYDKMANRWLLEQLEYNTSYQICIAVSQTDDATGKYNLYSYTFTGLPDYPKFGIWPDAYYLAFNFFGPGDGEPCALDRTAMLAGSKAAMICFNPKTSDMGFLPSDIDGSTPPPSGAPNHYIELGNSNTTLKEYDFHVDFSVPKNSTFTGPHTITVPAYTQLCGGGGGACIPEPHGGGLLDAIGDRMMFRNAYRNFGDHEAMVFSHSVGAGAGRAVAAERWYELRSTPPGGSFSLYQAGTYANKTNNYWMGSIAMDKNGDMALGFSVDNSSSLDPSIWFTGRVPTDGLGMLEGHKVVHKGTQVQGNVNRWGDYSSMSVDPTDDCTFWYTQEYTDGGYNWQSHVVSFKFTSCH
ncbi:MAG: hypothetical protein ACHP7J_06100 [Terriglobales bacterium]